MKKIIFSVSIFFSFFLLNFSFQLFGQVKGTWCEPDTITTYTIVFQTVDTVIMEPGQKCIMTYNDALLKTSELWLSWDEIEEAFTTKYGDLTLFSYNELGLLATQTDANWNSDINSWLNSYRYSYLYDTLGNIVQETHETWDDSLETFINYHQIIYTYNEHNNENSSMTQYWDQDAQAWGVVYGSQHTYLYDQNFNILADTTISLDNSDTTLFLFTYYPNGNLHTEMFGYSTGGNPWVWNDSLVYVYDDNNNMLSWTRYEWDDSLRFIYASWNGRLTFTYDENNNRTSHVREHYNYDLCGWEIDGWNPKLVWTYDDNDNAILIEAFAWNNDAEIWEPTLSGHVDLHYNNMQSGDETHLAGTTFHVHYICREDNVAVKENENLAISIYPNPTQDRLFIRGITERSQLTIYDISGKLVLKQGVFPEENVIHLKNLKSGIYLLTIRNNHQNITKKIVVTN